MGDEVIEKFEVVDEFFLNRLRLGIQGRVTDGLSIMQRGHNIQRCLDRGLIRRCEAPQPAPEIVSAPEPEPVVSESVYLEPPEPPRSTRKGRR